jgi:hypothetical protein
MNEHRIQALKQALAEFISLIQQENAPDNEQILVQVMEHVASRIQQIRQEGNQQPPPEQPPEGPASQTPNEPPSASAQLMWILAGQKEDIFLQYLQTYPDPELQALLRNPAELERNIQFLHQMMPSGRQPVSEEGIPHAEINSSNIYGFKYDPSSKSLLVKFQGNDGSGQGPVYKYDNVPPQIYKAFENGAVPAKTNGQNKWGRFWIGKIPSLGAAFYQLIRQGGYAYSRLS